MRILALDIATRTGFAIGPAGDKPDVGVIRLRKPGEDLDVSSTNLGHWLEHTFETTALLPDKLVYEAPLEPSVKMAMGRKPNARAQNNASAKLPYMNEGVLLYLCQKYGVEAVSCRRQTVLAWFTGCGNYGGGDAGRKAAKAAVIRCAQVYGMIPKTCADDDIADAVAIHMWASAFYARKAPRELVLLGETA